MSSIQDIHAFEEQIYDIVQDYVEGNYNQEDVIAISMRCGIIKLEVDSKEAVKIGKNTETYSLKELVRNGDNNELEPDVDKISDIANRWVFLD